MKGEQHKRTTIARISDLNDQGRVKPCLIMRSELRDKLLQILLSSVHRSHSHLKQKVDRDYNKQVHDSKSEDTGCYKTKTPKELLQWRHSIDYIHPIDNRCTHYFFEGKNRNILFYIRKQKCSQ